MLEDRTETQIEEGSRSEGSGRILVFWDGGSQSLALPASGTLSFGRAKDCDVCIEHASVSRRHAVLHVGEQLRVEDLGSSNGTRLSGQPIQTGQAVLLAPGQVIEIGSARVLVEHPSRRAPRAAPNAGPPSEISSLVMAESMRAAYRLIELVSTSQLNILIIGETGVGKELAAEAVHRGSPRAAGPFVRLNCAALPEALLESELFGHERGAFTGALAKKRGLLESANGGSVFLDEVAELPPSAQAKLLRAIESREITPLGALSPHPIDVRFIAATHADLNARVAEQRFRQDLYFRLNGASVVIPPLRERRSEIAPLAGSFVAQANRTRDEPAPSFARDTLARLVAYHWPGNIRELRNVVERAFAVSGGAEIQPEHLPPEVAGTGPSGVPPAQPPLQSELDALERQRIIDALLDSGGHQGRAAELLGISRRTLLHRLDAYGLPRPRKGKPPAKR